MRKPWSTDELETVRINYPHWPTYLVAHLVGRSETAVFVLAQKHGWRKTPAYRSGPWTTRQRRGGPAGASTRFQPGQVAHNKGVKRPPGWSPGRMAETQFKKGELSGRAAELLQPIGATRLSKDGYLERKIHNGLPMQSRWRAEHTLLWEEHLGPLPPGHAVGFRNGDRTDIRIDNLELVSRAEGMRRNSYHNRYPKEIGLAIQMRGALTRTINRRRRDELHDQ